MTKELNLSMHGKVLTEQLEFLSKKFKNRIAFSTSFGQEDQVITDAIFKNNIDIKVFTLDTGRMFSETYKVWNRTIEKYNKPIDTFFPETYQVEELLTKKGTSSFYNSQEDRKECCNIRKVFPLTRALKDVDLWITGLRSDQSVTRTEMGLFEQNDNFDLIKFNPLKDWSLIEVEDYLKNNQVPENDLHSKGFVSIGCAPCTRAIQPGDDIRAGRWWWEDKDKKECGLHVQK